jgi:drug/metabolite transporter (DMT)-like permease
MSHSRAVALMVVVTLMWSIAGVVTRHLEAARSFEVTFWRSAFTSVALALGLTWLRGVGLWRDLLRADVVQWVSGLCWAVMYTAFMIAITLTNVANVLITLAIAPLVTAVFARVALHHRLPTRTWIAIAVAGVGIAWMFVHEMQLGSGALGGMGVALAVPMAGAVNWTLLQHVSHGSGDPDDSAQAPDMLPAVLLGALISAAVALPLAWPLHASMHDLSLLALLGVVQLAIPCLIAVRLSQVLPGPEIALLALLEVLFGVTWAWLGAGEAPTASALSGGTLVLAALVGNEAIALQQRRQLVQGQPAR